MEIQKKSSQIQTVKELKDISQEGSDKMRVSRQNFEKGLIKLNMNLSEMGRILIDSMENVQKIITENDRSSADRIAENQAEIRDLARRVESRCIKLIMREAPVASDLRVISSSLKLVTDLEKIGRHTLDISELSSENDTEKTKVNENLVKMVNKTYDTLVDAVNAHIHNDVELVKAVIEADDVIDQLYLDIREEIVGEIKNDEIEAENAVNLLMQAKYLEKIGDHCEAVVEWINYSVTGEQPNTGDQQK